MLVLWPLLLVSIGLFAVCVCIPSKRKHFPLKSAEFWKIIAGILLAAASALLFFMLISKDAPLLLSELRMEPKSTFRVLLFSLVVSQVLAAPHALFLTALVFMLAGDTSKRYLRAGLAGILTGLFSSYSLSLEFALFSGVWGGLGGLLGAYLARPKTSSNLDAL